MPLDPLKENALLRPTHLPFEKRGVNASHIHFRFGQITDVLETAKQQESLLLEMSIDRNRQCSSPSFLKSFCNRINKWVQRLIFLLKGKPSIEDQELPPPLTQEEVEREMPFNNETEDSSEEEKTPELQLRNFPEKQLDNEIDSKEESDLEETEEGSDPEKEISTEEELDSKEIQTSPSFQDDTGLKEETDEKIESSDLKDRISPEREIDLEEEEEGSDPEKEISTEEELDSKEIQTGPSFQDDTGLKEKENEKIDSSDPQDRSSPEGEIDLEKEEETKKDPDSCSSSKESDLTMEPKDKEEVDALSLDRSNESAAKIKAQEAREAIISFPTPYRDLIFHTLLKRYRNEHPHLGRQLRDLDYSYFYSRFERESFAEMDQKWFDFCHPQSQLREVIKDLFDFMDRQIDELKGVRRKEDVAPILDRLPVTLRREIYHEMSCIHAGLYDKLIPIDMQEQVSFWMSNPKNIQFDKESVVNDPPLAGLMQTSIKHLLDGIEKSSNREELLEISEGIRSSEIYHMLRCGQGEAFVDQPVTLDALHTSFNGLKYELRNAVLDSMFRIKAYDRATESMGSDLKQSWAYRVVHCTGGDNEEITVYLNWCSLAREDGVFKRALERVCEKGLFSDMKRRFAGFL